MGASFQVPLLISTLEGASIPLFFVGLGLLYVGFRKYRIARLIEDTPTETCRAVAAGRTELTGEAVPRDEPARAPFSGDPCVAATYTVEETRESQGGTRWVTLEKGSVSVPFHVEDGTGRVLVDPADADFEVGTDHGARRTVAADQSPPDRVTSFLARGPEVGRKQVDRLDEFADSLGFTLMPTAVAAMFLSSASAALEEPEPDANAKRRYTEHLLLPGEDVYVYGAAVANDADGATDERLRIVRDAATDEFLVSDRTEEDLVGSYKRGAPVRVFGGLLLSALALYVILESFGV